MIDLEFIKRAEELTKNDVINNIKLHTQRNKKNVRKWEKSEKGKKKINERKKIIRDAVKNADPVEIWEIRKFYRNKPKGMVVDHIIPLSQGGKHTMSNLQYLTIEQNSSKGKRESYHKVYSNKLNDIVHI